MLLHVHQPDRIASVPNAGIDYCEQEKPLIRSRLSYVKPVWTLWITIDQLVVRLRGTHTMIPNPVKRVTRRQHPGSVDRRRIPTVIEAVLVPSDPRELHPSQMVAKLHAGP